MNYNVLTSETVNLICQTNQQDVHFTHEILVAQAQLNIVTRWTVTK